MTVIMARSYSASETDRLAVIPRPLRSSIFIAGTVGPDVAESAPPSTEEKVMLSFRGTLVLAAALALVGAGNAMVPSRRRQGRHAATS